MQMQAGAEALDVRHPGILTAVRFRAIHVDDLDRIRVDDELWWRPVRHPLNVTAFGINAFTADEPGQLVIERHDEQAGGAAGHEEAYVVLTGAARFELGEERLEARAGTIVFISDPALRRGAVAIEPHTTVLAIGGTPGAAMPPSVWENWFLADPHFRAGDYARAIEIASRGLADHPDHPSLHYQLACYHAQAGNEARALEHLKAAVAGNPRCRQWAADDSDLDPIRTLSDFPR